MPDRILTTHVGSLPRPPELIALNARRMDGELGDDAGYADPSGYSANIQAIVEEIRRAAPRAEFVLVSSMLPNPEWHYPQMERFAGYRRALADLCGPGIILADVTTLWTDVMARKSFYDLTGNGINHPNDFGHRLYSQTILSLFAE